MAKAKKMPKAQTPAAQDVIDQILSYRNFNGAEGGFGDYANARALQAGYTQEQIVRALQQAQARGVPITGKAQYIADNYDKLLAAERAEQAARGNSPNKNLSPALGGAPRLLWTPNSLITRGTGADTGEAGQRGFNFVYGTPNYQLWLDEKGWAQQIDSNPEVNYRYETGDMLNPDRDVNNYYGRLAEADLNGTSQSPEMVALARQAAQAYNNGDSWNKWGSEFLHESDPRSQAIANDPKAAHEYFTKFDPNIGSGKGKEWYQNALAGALDPLPGQQAGQASSQMGSTAGAGNYGSLTGKAKMQAIKGAERMGQALKIAASGDSLLGARESMAISRKFNKDVDKQVGRLDQINLNQAAKKGPIGLTANFTNKYAAGKLGNNPMASMYSFGQPKGGLAQALAGMNDRTTSNGPNQGGTTTTTGFGKTPKGFGVMGFAAGKPIYQTAKSLGGWNYNPKPKASTSPAPVTGEVGSGVTSGPVGSSGSGMDGFSDWSESSPSITPSAAQSGIGSSVTSGATRWSGNKNKNKFNATNKLKVGSASQYRTMSGVNI